MSTATQVRPQSLKLDKLHSSANFAVRHMVVSTFRGSFDEIDAGLNYDENGVPSLTGVVPVASINVEEGDLRGHLLSPEFFDAERNPEIRFESTSIETAAGENGEITTIHGDLTVKGHTERIAGKGTIAYIEADVAGGERYGVELEAKIDRNKFGLEWNAPLPKGGFALGDEVTLSVRLEFVPEG